MKIKLFVMALLCFLPGCKNDAKQEAVVESATTVAPKTVAYVSNYPLYYFTTRIGGSHVDVRFPEGSAKNPSAWTPDATEVGGMQGADLILLNGATYEGWLMNVSLPDSLLVDTSGDFSDRLLSGGETFTHSHGTEGEHRHEGVASRTWLDLGLALQQAQSIRNALVAKQPGHRADFEARYESLAADLLELDREFKNIGDGKALPKPAFSRPVFQYFMKAYHLEGPTLDWQAETPATHDMLHEIGHLQKDQGIGVLIWDQAPAEKSIAQLEQRGIRSVVIDPLEDMPENGDFITGMRSNLQALKSILPQD